MLHLATSNQLTVTDCTPVVVAHGHLYAEERRQCLPVAGYCGVSSSRDVIEGLL